jgi:hypothetical protein
MTNTNIPQSHHSAKGRFLAYLRGLDPRAGGQGFAKPPANLRVDGNAFRSLKTSHAAKSGAIDTRQAGESGGDAMERLTR